MLLALLGCKKGKSIKKPIHQSTKVTEGHFHFQGHPFPTVGTKAIDETDVFFMKLSNYSTVNFDFKIYTMEAPQRRPTSHASILCSSSFEILNRSRSVLSMTKMTNCNTQHAASLYYQFQLQASK